jgi:iron complex outermembrane receptor protein
MRRYFLLLVFFYITQILYAQQANISIEGLVKDELGNPLPFAFISIEGTSKGTTSDAKGKFKLSNMSAGNYSVTVSSIGFKTHKQPLIVGTNSKENFTITLQASNELLSEVIVTSRSTHETKDKLANSITVVDSKKIEETQIISSNPADILAVTVPGLGASSATSSNWGQTLRGRQVLVMVDGIPQSTPLRNGSVDLRVIDPYGLERVEVIRGATAIYGNGAAGGIINYITKRNTSQERMGGKTELALTGSIVSSKESIGARGYQSLYGRLGKFDYTISGSFEQTGVRKDALGDPIGPLYGLSNNEIYNGLIKLGYDITSRQRIGVSYNFFGSRDKTDLVEILGSIKEGRKTTVGIGEVIGEAPGTRFNHNALLKYSYDDIFAATNLNLTAYYQNLSTVFQYSPTFEGGGQSTIQSQKKGVRLDLNSHASVGSNLYGNLTYGVDLLNDVTSQPLLDGRTWVPNMDMRSLGPFIQLQATLFNHFVYNGGIRYENINIRVPDFYTLKPYNRVTNSFGESRFVKGGDLSYNNLAINSRIRYNKYALFKPFLNYSQGFSVADLGIVLRSSLAPDLSSIKTDAVLVNNYEAGFSTEHKFVRFEASTYVSKSKLGSSYQEINGLYEVVRSPERVWGYELALDLNYQNELTGGITYSYVEGKRDSNNNKKYEDEKDTYLGGDRIAAPKLTIFHTYSPISILNFRADFIGSGKRTRFPLDEATATYKTYEGAVHPYQVVNFSASAKLSDKATLNIGIENLFKEDYFPARSQWIMIDSYYVKGRGTSFTAALTFDFLS